MIRNKLYAVAVNGGGLLLSLPGKTSDIIEAQVLHSRGVAQPGSAPALGAGGRRFKSYRPDQSFSPLGGLMCLGNGDLMNILIAILIRIIEVMFVAGVAGSAIVVLLTSIEDFKMLFEKETSRKM